MNWDELDWSILERLRQGFISGSAAAGPYWQSEDDLAHYDFTFAERIGWKWDHVLDELVRRGWSPPSGPILDWGCGSGVASRRVMRQWPELVQAGQTLHVFDHSTLAENFSARRARETFPDLTALSWDRAAPISTVVISHVLNELDTDSAADLRQVIDRAEAVIWIEPGTSEVASDLVAWREQLREQFRLVYPCPHQGACGILAPGNERHWCHHFARPPAGIFADSHWVKFGQRAGIDLRSLPFSALVFERTSRPCSTPLPENAGRAIGRPQVFKPYARLLGCDAGGVAPLTLPKRTAPKLWKRLDRVESPRLFTWEHREQTLVKITPCLSTEPE
ncbi:small ribosomal subunit Rsm22 family protein [Synoicihabitans lomoniglobus]|uniref:Small ribosomal subunit Rsm22 family protein n=1 Tax=Synoicihabitans lomoniglobus TaxID=2909285 RepID=A0AAF0CR87_9BACT|nr:small ribosomal subunit Rsm22 family protein [Opitutaceae bacterium LMO-M01]WED66593.1 small ribosomal subunit Rsm22 family protein [Opitutaceae bacterium LMO-M01]